MCSSIEVAKHNKGQMTLSDLEKAFLETFLAILPCVLKVTFAKVNNLPTELLCSSGEVK